MSQENLEVVLRSYEAFRIGDIEGWLTTFDPDIELDERFLAPDAAVYRGHEGVLQWARSGLDVVESPRFEVLRWFDGGNVLVTEVAAYARGVGSGVETTARLAHAIRLRDQKIVYIASFPTVEEALEAAGLSEQDAHADS